MTDNSRRTDGRSGLSRRHVLAALSATGVAGAFAPGATGAFVGDAEVFREAGITTGSLDLGLCWEPAGQDEPCSPTNGQTVSIDLGELEPGATGSGTIRCALLEGSNPAWLWLRSPCASEACGVEGFLEVTLWYDEDCDGVRDDESPVVAANGEPIESVSLCRALNLLAAGTQLDGVLGSPGDVDPLDPEGDCCLGLEWTLTEAPCRSDSARIDLEFFAEQVRHNPEPVSPWPPRECQVDCDVDCDTECAPASFVAFCKDTPPVDMDAITSLTWTDESLTWTADEHFDSVVLYYGSPIFETFRPEGGFPAGPSHTITRGESEALSAAEAEKTYGQSTNDPCPDVDSEGCGIRYNFPESDSDSGSWDCVCGPPGPDRECGGDDDA